VYTYPCAATLRATPTGPESDSLCFGAGSFERGDCDGDGTQNGPASTFVRANCAQLAAVIDGEIAPLDGSLTLCASGATELGNASCAPSPSSGATVIGLACDAIDPCGVGGRCLIDTVSEQGVCVYPRVDIGRLTLTDEIDSDCFDPNRCIESSILGPSSFSNGDCDEDGLANRVDPDVCERVRSVRGDLTVMPAIVSEAGTRLLSPGHSTDDGVGFGFDCSEGRQHCPILDDGSDESVRCIDLPVGANAASVCTYEHGDIRDTSCIGTVIDHEACAFRGEMAYESWAEGDCDSDEVINKLDPFVCDATPPNDDAGMNVEAGVGPDGGSGTEDAASASGSDAGRVSFGGGGGCVCRAQAGSSGHGWMLILFAFVPMLRRRMRSV